MTDIVLFGLSVYRLSVLFVRDNGPGDIFVKLRMRLGVRFNEYNEEVSDGSFLPSIFMCVRCMSIWIAFLFGVLFWASPKKARFVAWPFAISGFACFLNEE